MEGDLKIVEFEKYCNSCVSFNKSAKDEPCNTCLGIPARVDSHKPEKYVEERSKKSNGTYI